MPSYREGMTNSQLRRPRFERSAVRLIHLTDRDLAILSAVHRYRLLRSTDLQQLVSGGHQGMLRRLQLLFHHGYLDRPLAQLDWYRQGSESLVYALGQRGARELARREGGTLGAIRFDTKNQRLSRFFLRHVLAVAEVMVAIEVACRERPDVELITKEEIASAAPFSTQRERLPFRWQVEVTDRKQRYRLGVEPDAVFGLRFRSLQSSRATKFFFLEVDRGTMPVARKGLAQSSLRRKLLAYEATWRQGIYRSRLGMGNFRVMFIVANEKRRKHLATIAPEGGNLFLYTDKEPAYCDFDDLAQNHPPKVI